MLMLVGGADRIVDPEGSRIFFESAPEDLREMVWFDTGYHEIFNEAEPLRGEVFAALTGWLRQRLELRQSTDGGSTPSRAMISGIPAVTAGV
jgi:lysophospholipase